MWIRTNDVVNILCQGLTKPVHNNNCHGGAVSDLINISFLGFIQCSSPITLHSKEPSSPIFVVGISQYLHAYPQMVFSRVWKWSYTQYF